jgi:hypothetical protein
VQFQGSWFGLVFGFCFGGGEKWFGGVGGEFLGFDLGVGFLDFGLLDKVGLDFLSCRGKSDEKVGKSNGENSSFLLLRRYVPSGRFAGPTLKPLRFFIAGSARDSEDLLSPSRVRLGAMIIQDRLE